MTRHPEVPTRPRRFRIVVGVDLSEYSEIVIEHALDQAARHHSPELHFLHVKESRKRSAEELKQRLASAVYPPLQTFNQYGTEWRARLHVRSGRPDEQIGALAADVRGELIVIGQFGVHNPKETYKNLPNRVLRAAPCPTLVVGMPPEADTSPICGACAVVREDSEGDRWFCDVHSDFDRVEHTVTATTVWTGGSLMW